MSEEKKTPFIVTLDLLEAELDGEVHAVRRISITELRDLAETARAVSQARANIASASMRDAIEKEIPVLVTALKAAIGGYTRASAPAASAPKRTVSSQNIERWRELISDIAENGHKKTLTFLRAFIVRPAEVDWNVLVDRLSTDLGDTAAREFMEITAQAWEDKTG